MPTKSISRYFQLPALIRLLTEQQMSLVSPTSWEDTNDSHFLEVYRQKKKLSCVLAACFTEASESFHLWRVFGHGPSGVCVRFDREFLEELVAWSGVRWGKVKYLTLNQFRAMKHPDLDRLPFLKRAPYVDEVEYRLIYESKTDERKVLDLPVHSDAIQRITLSPWVPYSQYLAVKELLHGIPECDKLKIVRSTLIGNQEWKELAQRARIKKKRKRSA